MLSIKINLICFRAFSLVLKKWYNFFYLNENFNTFFLQKSESLFERWRKSSLMGNKRKTSRRNQGVAITTNAPRNDVEVNKRRNSGLLGLPQR